ncbi:hypothetical protein OQA88_1600 [Cercophora sp. LCS_1]
MATAAGDAASGAAPAKSYSADPALYIYTSLTAGSSHIVTATSRLETILRANRVPFKAIDIATDEKARMLWGRRAGKDESGRVRKLPGLVQMGMILGDLVEIEEWNEYGELKQHVTMYYDEFTQPPISQAPKPPAAPAKPPVVAVAQAAAAEAAKAAAAASSAPKPPPLPTTATSKSASSSGPPKSGATVTLPVRSVAEEAAQKAKQMHLQSLREKVYGKGAAASGAAEEKKKAEAGKKAEESSEEEDESEEESEEESEDEEEETVKKPPASAVGLQSPKSTGWKDGSVTAGLQSPTSTSWKPTDVDRPITSFLGGKVESASAEKIAAVERSQTIKEEDDEEDDDDSDDDDEEESSEEEEEVKPKAKQ